jgi:outer membrane lipase/esterase
MTKNRPKEFAPFRCLLALIISLASVPLAANAQSAEYSALYVFGDSLSDPGNAYAITGLSEVPPFEVIPSAPYEIGDFHFSNGRTWVEYAAPSLGLLRGSLPAFERPFLFGNFAIGGSRAGPGTSPLQTLGGQLAAYLFTAGGNANSEALYAIALGSNDIRDATEAAVADPTLATSFAIIQAAVDGEAAGIANLYAAGARNFFILNAPNVALAPAVKDEGPLTVITALIMTNTFNSGLNDAIARLQTTLPGINIQLFDTFTALSYITANPELFGLENVQDPCLTFFVTEDVYCANPDTYLFWDGIHPTTAGHRAIARLVVGALSGS